MQTVIVFTVGDEEVLVRVFDQHVPLDSIAVDTRDAGFTGSSTWRPLQTKVEVEKRHE